MCSVEDLVSLDITISLRGERPTSKAQRPTPSVPQTVRSRQQAACSPDTTIFHIPSFISRQDANVVHKLHLDCFTSCLPDFDELSLRLLPTDPRHSSSHKFNKRREEKRREEKRREVKRSEGKESVLVSRVAFGMPLHWYDALAGQLSFAQLNV